MEDRDGLPLRLSMAPALDIKVQSSFAFPFSTNGNSFGVKGDKWNKMSEKMEGETQLLWPRNKTSGRIRMLSIWENSFSQFISANKHHHYTHKGN